MFGLKERRAGPRTEEQANAKARKIGVLFLTFALPALLVFLTYKLQFRQLTDPDVMDMGQIARNMTAGKGFATSVVRPLALSVINKPDVLNLPDVNQAPLYPTVLAITLAMGGSDKRVFLTSVLFFFLTIPVLLNLARAMFNQRVANLALFAYATSVMVLTSLAASGPGLMLAFLFTSLCLALFRYAQASASTEDAKPDVKAQRRFAIISGVLAALCYLADYMLFFTILPVAVFIYMAGGPARKKGLAAFLVAFLIPAGIWWVRNMMVGVNPFLGLRILEIGMGTTEHPGLTLYRSMTPITTLGLLQVVKGEVLKKMAMGLLAAYQHLTSLGTPFLMAFFVVGLFYSFRRVGVNAVRGVILAAFLCVLIFGSLFSLGPHTVVAFIPVLLAFGMAFFVRMLTDTRLPGPVERLVVVAAIIVVSLPLVYRFWLVRAPRVNSHQAEATVGHIVAANVPVVTDRVFQMAWYGGRTSIWLPATEADVQKLEKVKRQGALHISSGLLQYPGNDFAIWGNIFAQAVQGMANPNGMQLMKIKGKTLDGFGLFQGVDPVDAQELVKNPDNPRLPGNLLFMRPEGLRKQGR